MLQNTECRDGLNRDRYIFRRGESGIHLPDQYTQVRWRLRVIAVGQERYREVLDEVPHVQCCDLALLMLYAPQGKEGADRAIVISHRQREQWGKSVVQLYQDAVTSCARALPARLQSLKDAIGLPGEEKTAAPECLVLTNENNRFGAACIFYPGVQEEAASRIGGSYFALPSSLHEMLLLKDDHMGDAASLKDIVCSVNRREVEERDILTDSVYYYDAVLKKFRRVA